MITPAPTRVMVVAILVSTVAFLDGTVVPAADTMALELNPTR
jgi:hypothetical protein